MYLILRASKAKITQHFQASLPHVAFLSNYWFIAQSVLLFLIYTLIGFAKVNTSDEKNIGVNRKYIC